MWPTNKKLARLLQRYAMERGLGTRETQALPEVFVLHVSNKHKNS
jgi:hypothetical protein